MTTATLRERRAGMSSAEALADALAAEPVGLLPTLQRPSNTSHHYVTLREDAYDVLADRHAAAIDSAAPSPLVSMVAEQTAADRMMAAHRARCSDPRCACRALDEGSA